MHGLMSVSCRARGCLWAHHAPQPGLERGLLGKSLGCGPRRCPGLPELHGWSGLGPEKGPFGWQGGSRPCPAHPVGRVKCSEGTGGQAMSELCSLLTNMSLSGPHLLRATVGDIPPGAEVRETPRRG